MFRKLITTSDQNFSSLGTWPSDDWATLSDTISTISASGFTPTAPSGTLEILQLVGAGELTGGSPQVTLNSSHNTAGRFRLPTITYIDLSVTVPVTTSVSMGTTVFLFAIRADGTGAILLGHEAVVTDNTAWSTFNFTVPFASVPIDRTTWFFQVAGSNSSSTIYIGLPIIGYDFTPTFPDDLIASLQLSAGPGGNPEIVRFSAITGARKSFVPYPDSSYEPPSGCANDSLGFDYIPASGGGNWINKIGLKDQAEWYNDSGGEDDRIDSTCFTQGHIWWIGLNAAGTANLVGLNPDGSIFATYLTSDGDLSFAGGCCADANGIVYWVNSGSTTLRKFDTNSGTQLTDVTLSLPIGGRINIVNFCITSDGSYILGVWYGAVASIDYLFIWNSDGSLHWYSTFDEVSSHGLAGGGACFSSDDLTVYTVHDVPHAVEPTFGVVFDHRAISSSGFGANPETFDWVFDPDRTYLGDMILMWLGSPLAPLHLCDSYVVNRIIGHGQTSADYPEHSDIAAITKWIGSTTPGTPAIPGTLLPNGDFGTGDLTDWTAGGIITPSVVNYPTSGKPFSCFLGNPPGSEPSGDSWIEQTFTVPSSSPGFLTLDYWPYSEDSISFDWQEGQLRDLSDSILVEFFKVCTNDPGTKYTASVDLTPFVGETVKVWINVHQDGFGDVTNMYVDNIAIGGAPDVSDHYDGFVSPMSNVSQSSKGDFFIADEGSTSVDIWYARESDHKVFPKNIVFLGVDYEPTWRLEEFEGHLYAHTSNQIIKLDLIGSPVSVTHIDPYWAGTVETINGHNIIYNYLWGSWVIAPDGSGFYCFTTYNSNPFSYSGVLLVKVSFDGSTVTYISGSTASPGNGAQNTYVNGAKDVTLFAGSSPPFASVIDPAGEWIYFPQPSSLYIVSGTIHFDPACIRRVSLIDGHSETFCGQEHGVIDLNTYTGPLNVEGSGTSAIFATLQFIDISKDGNTLLLGSRNASTFAGVTYPCAFYLVDIPTATLKVNYVPDHDPGVPVKDDWDLINLLEGTDGYLYGADYSGGYIVKFTCGSLNKWYIGQIGWS